MATKKNNHGGKRKGAGRPAVNTVRLEARVTPATRDKLDRWAAADRKTIGQVVDWLAGE